MSLLLSIINEPSQLSDLSIKQWELLIRQARASQLLAYLAEIVNSNTKLTPPQQAQNHLAAALHFAQKQKKHVLVECGAITEILKSINVKPIFLKGAAYALKDLNLSNTRLLSDIDVLIKKDDIEKSELTLFQQGWFSEEITDYDDMYYRQWAHEIPPLKHVKRHTILDLHHNILPLMTGHPVDVDKLFKEAASVPSIESAAILSNSMLVMHSAIHLFHESEFNKGLRDLIDIKTMINYFLEENNHFIEELIETAQYFKFEREIYYALKYSDLVLHTQFLPSYCSNEQLKAMKKWDSAILDFAFIHVMQPYHPSCHHFKKALAEFILYWRGHLIRMPLKLLIPHLFKKSWMRIQNALVE